MLEITMEIYSFKVPILQKFKASLVMTVQIWNVTILEI